MVIRGHVQNGVVVLDDGVRLLEGQEVTILASPRSNPLQQKDASIDVPKERKDALHQLIGIWKTDLAPSDEQIERMLDQQRMKKYA